MIRKLQRWTVWLLLLLLVCPLGAQEQLGELEVEIRELEAPVPANAKVLVRATLSDLQFESNRGIIREEKTGDGEWKITLEPGNQRFTIKVPGYLSFSKRMVFKNRRAYQFTVRPKLSGQMRSLDENLYEVTFRLDPGDVNCSVEPFGSVPSQGNIALFKLPRGEYTFHFEKNQYQSLSRTLKIDGDSEFRIKLVPDKNRHVPYQPPGIVIITSDPPGAEVILNGQKMGVTPFNKQIPAGEYQLEIRKHRYGSAQSTFTLAEAETKRLNEVLKLQEATVDILSHPTGARVFIDNKEQGTTPLRGLKVGKGLHHLRAELELFHSHEEDFTVEDGQEVTLEFQLQAGYGSLIVDSAPETGAEVRLDGELLGVTPLEKQQLASGTYLLEVSKQYFDTVSEEVVISDGKTTRRTIIMGSNVGRLRVTAPGARIYVDGKYLGDEEVEQVLSPGTYKVRAEKPSHHPAEQDVVLAVGQTRRVELEPDPIQGSLSVFTDPPDAEGAEIFINDHSYGNAPKVIPLLVGTYQVSLTRGSFRAPSRKVKVTENQDTRVEFQLPVTDLVSKPSTDWVKRDTFREPSAPQVAGAAGHRLSLYTGLAFAGAAVLLEVLAGGAYNDYQQAESSADALDQHRLVRSLDVSAQGCALVSVSALGYWTYQVFKGN